MGGISDGDKCVHCREVAEQILNREPTTITELTE